ncbi:MAG: IS630 transposase-related protein [Candidatus Competibacter sp.]|nr:IS630 transposase-related protein [Candidatus Competibacter sp.]
MSPDLVLKLTMPSTTLPHADRYKLRAQVLAAVASGMSITKAAKLHRLSSGTVHHWVKNPHLAMPGGDRRFSLDWAELKALALANPDATAAELARHFDGITYNAVLRALKIMNIPTGKRRK